MLRYGSGKRQGNGRFSFEGLRQFKLSIGLPVHPNGARRFPDVVFRPTPGALLREFENRFQAKNARPIVEFCGNHFHTRKRILRY